MQTPFIADSLAQVFHSIDSGRSVCILLGPTFSLIRASFYLYLAPLDSVLLEYPPYSLEGEHRRTNAIVGHLSAPLNLVVLFLWIRLLGTTLASMLVLDARNIVYHIMSPAN